MRGVTASAGERAPRTPQADPEAVAREVPRPPGRPGRRIVGTSSWRAAPPPWYTHPVAGLPGPAARATYIVINPEPRPLTARAGLSVRAPVGSFLAPLLPSLDPPLAAARAPGGFGGSGEAAPPAQEEDR